MDIMNSSILWVVCGVMVVAVVGQSLWMFRTAWKEAENLGMEKQTLKSGIRAAGMTALGPSFASVIALVSLIIFVGGPVGWMRVCDIGAPRTELAVITMAKAIIPADANEILTFSYQNWVMALDNMGWMIVALVLTPRMSSMVDKMNKKFDPVLVKLVMAGAAFGLFGNLWVGGVLGKAAPAWAASAAAIVSMVVLNKFFAKSRTLIELSFGIAMIIGMIAATVVHYGMQ